MQHSLARIIAKPTDYKICNQCGCVNWYENKVCVNGCNDPQQWVHNSTMVKDFIENDYEFYSSEGYSEDEIDNITRDV